MTTTLLLSFLSVYPYDGVVPVLMTKEQYDSCQNVFGQRLPVIKAVSNNHVPDYVNVDMSKAVGQIPVVSGTTRTGAKTYEVPIEVYPGMNGFQPHLSLVYNSQQGDSNLGIGWGIKGLSSITRGGKSIYYDGRSEGVRMDNSDSFWLDGIRLIKTGGSDDTPVYESMQGNIKARGHVSGDVMQYFEVFYPDGNKGIFGFEGQSVPRLVYPLTVLTDLYGNEIAYEYQFSYGLYHITRISYNGCTVDFQYADRSGTMMFSGGERVDQSRLLEHIVTYAGIIKTGEYSFDFISQNGNALLGKIHYSKSGSEYNPLVFYYGEGNTASGFKITETNLISGFPSSEKDKIRIEKGRLDPESNTEGLILFQNRKSYKRVRDKKMYNRFENQYEGDEPILIYSGLDKDWVSPMPDFQVGKGFLDLFCCDLEGDGQDYVVKINNEVGLYGETLTFNIYCHSSIVGIQKMFEKTFTVGMNYTDGSGYRSACPKFFYPGDFDGDGKMEILAVSANDPFGKGDRPSLCYIFDLRTGDILFQSTVFLHNVEYWSYPGGDGSLLHYSSDKVLIMDYDGDGKSDICHVGDSGLEIYTFEKRSGKLYANKVSTVVTVNKTSIKNKELLVGDFNGDGLMDIGISPDMSTESADPWKLCYSKGNGQFYIVECSGPTNLEGSRFMAQDINGDGTTDLIRYDSRLFQTYLAKQCELRLDVTQKFANENSILVPSNVNSRNTRSGLVCLYDAVATKYSYNGDERKSNLLTGMANSLGVVEKNEYRLLTESSDEDYFYTKGGGAAYPYINIKEDIPVLTAATDYVDGKIADCHDYGYEQAVFHRQGLGFCGFGKIMSVNHRNQFSQKTYDPYRFGIPLTEKSPIGETNYDCDVSVDAHGFLKIRLDSKKERDLLKGIEKATAYTYDQYGYPLTELETYSDGISVRKENSYASNPAIGEGYNLGYLVKEDVTVDRYGDTYTEGMLIASHHNRLPGLKILFKNGIEIGRKYYGYDLHGNLTMEENRKYASSDTDKEEYEYDTLGRLVKYTDPLGLSETYCYNSPGQLSQKTDFRGNSTNYTLDVFGRTRIVRNPDGRMEFTEYDWAASTDPGLYKISTHGPGKPTKTVYYDALNREVRRSEVRFNGNHVNIDSEYDAKGNLSRQSEPYFSNAPPSGWTVYTYDEYDRPITKTEPSGAKTTYSYYGNSETIHDELSTTVKTYDSQGDMTSVSDEAGTVEYTLRADGQPAQITAPGNVTTSFLYDGYGRQTDIYDPSQGHVHYSYDPAGNLASQTDAEGRTISNEYDSHGRLVRKVCDEFTTDYTYDGYGDLESEISDNGTSRHFTYDKYGRPSSEREDATDDIWLRRDYTYTDGNIGSILYTSHKGAFCKETYLYVNGHLYGMDTDDGYPIYRLLEENAFGQPTKAETNGVTREYGFSPRGLPTYRKAYEESKTYQHEEYVFDEKFKTLTSRTDVIHGLTETFGYDSMRRLTSYGDNTAEFDAKGNILEKSDVGTFGYDLPAKPYAISRVEPTGDEIKSSLQEITYTSFGLPATITEDGVTATFDYNADHQRVRMTTTAGGKTSKKYYLGGCYEYAEGWREDAERLYLFGDYYSSPAILTHTKSTLEIAPPIIGGQQTYSEQSGVSDINWESRKDLIEEALANLADGGLFLIFRDYLGSVTQIVRDSRLIREHSYDAWGRMRNPSTWEVYAPGKEPSLYGDRGYTGHEHLPKFGLVNMNARLYDPVLGRFLSPDPFVQCPDWSQNFNRYTYAMNNPLCYIDEDGQFFWFFIGLAAVIGGGINVYSHWGDIMSAGGGWKSFGRGLAYFGIGGAAGAAGATMGMGAIVGFGGMLGVTSGYFAAATYGYYSSAYFGLVTGATNGFILGTSNSLMEGKRFDESVLEGFMEATAGGFGGAILCGIGGGIRAVANGRQFLSGEYTNRTLVQRAANLAEDNIGESGCVAGTKKHTHASELIKRYQSIYKDRGMEVNVRMVDKNNRLHIMDVVDVKNKMIYDWKFGYPNKAPYQLNITPQMQNYRNLLGIPSEIIKPYVY